MTRTSDPLDGRPEPVARSATGLTERGARRREELLLAALRIIVRDGPGAATLRTVVTEADTSHGLVSYYFGTREELIRAALELIATRNVEAMAAVGAEIGADVTDVDRVAGIIARHSAHQMIDDQGMGITIIELHLAAARYAPLRPIIRDWGRAYAQILRDTMSGLGSQHPEADAALLVSMISGLVMTQLALPRTTFEADVLRPAVARYLRSLSLDGGITPAAERPTAATPPSPPRRARR